MFMCIEGQAHGNKYTPFARSLRKVPVLQRLVNIAWYSRIISGTLSGAPVSPNCVKAPKPSSKTNIGLRCKFCLPHTFNKPLPVKTWGAMSTRALGLPFSRRAGRTSTSSSSSSSSFSSGSPGTASLPFANDSTPHNKRLMMFVCFDFPTESCPRWASTRDEGLGLAGCPSIGAPIRHETPACPKHIRNAQGCTASTAARGTAH